MVRRIFVVMLSLMLLVPVANVVKIENDVEQIKNLKVNREKNDGITEYELHIPDDGGFNFKIYTRYNGVEKETPILQSIFKGIDVDNNASTGENGKDIKIGMIVLPYFNNVNGSLIFAFSFALKVIRLGEEIKNGELELYFKGTLSYNGMHNFVIGFYSPPNEELPKEIREVITVVPYLLYDKEPEFYINVEPVFEGGQSNLSAILQYSNGEKHKVIIDYLPAVDTLIKISPNFALNSLGLAIEREAGAEETIRIRYYGKKNISLTLEDIPQEMAFTIEFMESYFEYKASDEFNASLIIELLGMDICMKIEYLPRHLIAQLAGEGRIYIFVDERKTRFILADSLEEPTAWLALGNLSGEAILRWRVGNEGFIGIDGMKGLQAELKMNMDELYFRMFSCLKAEHFIIGWNISSAGYIEIDTDWEWLSYYSFNLTVNDVFGILIEAGFLRAQDYRVEWNAIPPSFITSGEIDFIGDIVFAIMFNGDWYYIFS